MTKAQLLNNISSEEITEWIIEYKIRDEDARKEKERQKSKNKSGRR